MRAGRRRLRGRRRAKKGQRRGGTLQESYGTIREHAAVYRVPAGLLFGLPIAALLAQSYLPLWIPPLHWLNLPLVAIVWISLTWRNPVSSMLWGTAIGLTQDSLAHMPLGINGISGTLTGYIAASLGGRVDAEHPWIRFLLLWSLYWLNLLVWFSIEKYLMEAAVAWPGWNWMFASLVNAGLGVVIFAVCDRFRTLR